MKVIEFNTPDGVYQLELELVAKDRADYYIHEKLYLSKDSEEYKEEVTWVMEDDFEGIDWLINNTNYEDWEEVTKKINNDVNVTMDDFWCDSDDFTIIEV